MDLCAMLQALMCRGWNCFSPQTLKAHEKVLVGLVDLP